MTTHVFERRGVPAVQHKVDVSWRDWAYEAAKGKLALVEPPISVVAQPFCKDRRGLSAAGSQWPIVDLILDGFVAAGLIADRHPERIVEVVMRRAAVEGKDGMRVTISDGDPPPF